MTYFKIIDVKFMSVKIYVSEIYVSFFLCETYVKN